MQVVGLEVSTSSAKAILFSQSGEVIGECTQELPTSVSGVTWQEPEGIFSVALQCLRGVTRYAKGPIYGIGLAGIWHSLLLLDEARKPLEPIRTWADLSLANCLQDIKQDENVTKDFYQKSGCTVHGMYPLWKLYGLKKAQSPLFSKTRYVSSQIEHLFERFTGDVRVSACTASGSGFLNIHTATWDQELADFAGIRLDMLAPLAEADYWAPLSAEVASLTGLEAGIPVTVGCADGALNQIGSGAMSSGVMTLSVGTSGAVRISVPKPLLGGTGTWCYYLMNGQRLAGAATHGASNLEWYMRQFGYTGKDHERLAAAAAELSVGEGPFFLPFIFGERAPGWNEERGGGFVGLRSNHSEAHLYKAVLEGILFVLYHSYLQLVEIVTEPEQIRVSGGILKSRYWSKMAANIWGMPLFTTGNVHESTLGAALLALQVCGGLTSVKDFDPPLVGRVDPDEKMHALYKERFARYLELYQALARW